MLWLQLNHAAECASLPIRRELFIKPLIIMNKQDPWLSAGER